MTRRPANFRKGDGLIAFLARIDEFRSLHEAGHQQVSIYDKAKDSLPISFSQFSRYMGQYVLKKAPHNEHQRGQSTTISPVGKNSASSIRKPSTTGTTSKSVPFQHNPDGRDRDDLV